MFTWLIWIAVTTHGELSARLYRFIERRVDVRICINLDTLGLDWSKLEDRAMIFNASNSFYKRYSYLRSIQIWWTKQSRSVSFDESYGWFIRDKENRNNPPTISSADILKTSSTIEPVDDGKHFHPRVCRRWAASRSKLKTSTTMCASSSTDFFSFFFKFDSLFHRREFWDERTIIKNSELQLRFITSARFTISGTRRRRMC